MKMRVNGRKYYFPSIFIKVNTPYTKNILLSLFFFFLKQTLYNLQARKVAVLAVIPLGCLPQALVFYPTTASTCVEFINDSVRLFNSKLVSLINNLNSNLPGARFTYIDTHGILSTNLTSTLGKNYIISQTELQ